MDKERRYRQRLTASYTVNGLKQLKEAEQRQHHEAEKQLLVAQQIQLKKDMKAEAAAARLEHIESVRGETLQHPLRLEKVEWVLGQRGRLATQLARTSWARSAQKGPNCLWTGKNSWQLCNRLQLDRAWSA
jgi:hypothetical protein